MHCYVICDLLLVIGQTIVQIVQLLVRFSKHRAIYYTDTPIPN